MPDALLQASITVAEQTTLIVPLGLFILTVIWALWMLYRRDKTR